MMVAGTKPMNGTYEYNSDTDVDTLVEITDLDKEVSSRSCSVASLHIIMNEDIIIPSSAWYYTCLEMSPIVVCFVFVIILSYIVIGSLTGW
jgi:hypothetical protein